jgi:hypothetical protein
MAPVDILTSYINRRVTDADGEGRSCRKQLAAWAVGRRGETGFISSVSNEMGRRTSQEDWRKFLFITIYYCSN